MKRWSLDARSRRRKPQTLCSGVGEELANRTPSEESRSTRADTLLNSLIHEKNRPFFAWPQGTGYVCEYTQGFGPSMTIRLTKTQIDTALPAVAIGLNKYLWLQTNRDASDLRSNPQYKRRFNHFYRVRRGKEWQDHFYSLLETKKGKRVCFSEVLDAMYLATNRYEASFASKLLATVEPSMPVIDSIVLRNLNLRLPASNSKERAARIASFTPRCSPISTNFSRWRMESI